MLIAAKTAAVQTAAEPRETERIIENCPPDLLVSERKKRLPHKCSGGDCKLRRLQRQLAGGSLLSVSCYNEPNPPKIGKTYPNPLELLNRHRLVAERRIS